MKLSTRAGAGLAVLLVLVTALVAYQLRQTRRLLEANRQMAAADIEMSRASLRLTRQLDRLDDLTRRFLILEDPAYVEELSTARRLAFRELASLRSLAMDVGVVPTLRALGLTWSGYLELATELEVVAAARRSPDEVGEPLLASIAELHDLVERLDREAAARVSERIRISAQGAADARRAALLVGIAGLVLAFGLAVWIGHSTAAPLRALNAGTRAMSQGDFSHRVDPRGPAEIAALAEDFNRMARRLGELDQLKRDFLANVSHDLKAPLASIHEANQFLLEVEPERLTPEQRRLLELNAQSARRLEGMIADLLDVARLEAGSVEYRTEPVDLLDCCEQALEHSEGLRAAKGIEIERRGFDEPVRVDIDPPMFSRAVSNVFSNASDFSPPSGTIRLSLRLVSDHDSDLPVTARQALAGQPGALLTIEDQGPGVPEEDRERIFDRFYRADTHPRSAGGTGLGLAISRSIIEAHGGRIWVEPGENDGSVFAILMPLHPEATP